TTGDNPMPTMTEMNSDTRQELIDRLKRIEGQARGIQKMIDDGRDCEQVMTQIAALKAATHALSGEMLEAWTIFCMSHPDRFASPEVAARKMVDLVVKNSR
ncbi:MAG TPA: metal-sensitive transcriptional regulator, partial [Thermomicrobiales bacterium]|nr:metal-sensitive transcriptional regulator [Thermomicrobiales bacterium]